MAHYQKSIEQPERHGGHHEQINRGNLLVHGAGAAPLTLQVYVALLKDGQLDLKEFERMTAPGGR